MSVLEAAITSFIDRKMAQAPTTAPDHPEPAQRSLAKGLLAGLVGGLAGTAAKSLAAKFYPPLVEGQPEPPEVLADKVAGHELEPAQTAAASEAIHWGFGATVGAAYGAIAEFYPAATSRDGASFGMTLMALTHESALPAMGLSASPREQTTREKTSEMASHIAYGLVTEITRRMVRKML